MKIVMEMDGKRVEWLRQIPDGEVDETTTEDICEAVNGLIAALGFGGQFQEKEKQ